MSCFECPECGSRSLDIAFSIEVDSDDSDDMRVQLVECSSCGLGAVALYEESRRGEGDSWHHRGIKISSLMWQDLARMFRLCRRPMNKLCGCDVHLELPTLTLRLYKEAEDGETFGMRYYSKSQLDEFIDYLVDGRTIFEKVWHQLTSRPE